MKRRQLLLCRGGSCRKSLRKKKGLKDELALLPVDVSRVGCQKICKGPVVGVEVDGQLEWFERMGSKKAVRELCELVRKDEIPKPLRKRHHPERSGKTRS